MVKISCSWCSYTGKGKDTESKLLDVTNHEKRCEHKPKDDK